jgi:hypothetical protein
LGSFGLFCARFGRQAIAFRPYLAQAGILGVAMHADRKPLYERQIHRCELLKAGTKVAP